VPNRSAIASVAQFKDFIAQPRQKKCCRVRQGGSVQLMIS
jgi:hypothetical protein